jgi:D-alanyl-D-alanine dipeptidase
MSVHPGRTHPGPLVADPGLSAVRESDNGEPLVDARDWLRFDIRNADPRGDYGHLRRGVLSRLQTAESLLPNGFGLLVIEGYRPRGADAQDDADDAHQTGGAVDLTLCDRNGIELDLDSAALGLRPELARVLTAVGFVGDAAQWWHWSYGDRYWAYRTGRTQTVYAPTTRPLPRQRRWPHR